jgi:cobalt-zinc-cadmium efflux system outer membrane protein
MCGRFVLESSVICVLVGALCQPAVLGAQDAPGLAPAQVGRITMADAVRLTLERNQTLRAQRLAIDASRADAITAQLRPNVNFAFSVTGLSVFTPSRFTLSTASSNVFYDAGVSYTFERGGKRDKRMAVAADAIDVATKDVLDAERQLRFQAEQAFINVLLAKSTLDVTTQDLKNFSDFVDLNQQRVKSGDLAEADFLPISLQRLRFQTDVSAAQVALVQAKAALRQLIGFEGVPDDFDVDGELAFVAPPISLEDLKREALAWRPDLHAAQTSLRAAQDTAVLERANGARNVNAGVDYTKSTGSNALGANFSFDLPFHDQNQGNIAKADVAVRQATEMEAASRYLVLTDVASAFAAFQTSAQVVKLYESGYLDQARQSLDITTYAFQRGASSLLNVLDAERTYRDVQLNYRQALAALMMNARQLNFVVGRQVVP